METQQKKRVLSLIQPTGTFTLGNYLGALKNFVGLQDEYECVYGLADLHAITVRQEPAALRKNVLDGYAMLLAMRHRPGEEHLFHPEPGAGALPAGLDFELLHPVWGALPHDPVQG